MPSSARDRAYQKLEFEPHRRTPNFRWNGRALSAAPSFIVVLARRSPRRWAARMAAMDNFESEGHR